MPKRTDTILAEALREKGFFLSENLDELLKEADLTGESLQDILIRKKILSEKDILTILSEKLKVPFLDLSHVSIEKRVLEKVPLRIASYYRFLPIGIKDRTLIIAVSSPLEIKTQDEIRTQLGLDIEFVLALSKDILEGLKNYYGFAAETVKEIVTSSKDTSPFKEKIEDIEKLSEDASVIKLVNQIILEGWKKRATDIHIEPYRNSVALRYRIDGILYDAPVPPEMNNLLNAIISRIKIMSNLNIVERRLPQDGRAIVKVQEQVLDLRISTMPTSFGESVVIRILPTKMLFSLEKLGLSSEDLRTFESLIQKPHGIIFVTGPTGSGKTTTLYACLNKINTRDRKIITLEDPIEYEMQGITQIQVMPEIGLDFSRGLRSVLRHDPDVIMVGEVRDLETAEIAIRVALTGHLVFSTLHTNDAPSGITRLLDIGVEPYLLASSVEAFIAQRLIRLICPECKYEDVSFPQEIKDIIARDLKITSNEVRVFRGKGCHHCNFTGFFGRTAIYEILKVDEIIKDLIIKKAPALRIKRVAISRGMRTLRMDGWRKVVSGLTTPEEVMRVTPAEETGEISEGKFLLPIESLELPLQEKESLERRIYPRLDSKINLSYKVVSAEEDLLKKGLNPEQFTITKNISAGGLLFYTEEPMQIGLILELKIELPDGKEPIECLAKVVRIEELEEKRYNVAVCFLDITGADRNRLNKYIEKER